MVPRNSGLQSQPIPLNGQSDRWSMDFDAMQGDVLPGTRLFMFCNPQNPTGRVYSKSELVALADFCMQHDLVLCSDEIHASLVLTEDARHIPIASLSPEIANRTISLYAPSKTYNIPGLSCAVAVIPNPELRHAFKTSMAGLVPLIGPLAQIAAEAALSDETTYVPELLEYLRGNLALLREVAGDRMSPVEGTYLAWIDLRETSAAERPGSFLESHGIGLSDGAAFGGPGFVRFNFACPRSLLEQGLERLDSALKDL
jgi:cystathionine beta-lyase